MSGDGSNGRRGARQLTEPSRTVSFFLTFGAKSLLDSLPTAPGASSSFLGAAVVIVNLGAVSLLGTYSLAEGFKPRAESFLSSSSLVVLGERLLGERDWARWGLNGGISPGTNFATDILRGDGEGGSVGEGGAEVFGKLRTGEAWAWGEARTGEVGAEVSLSLRVESARSTSFWSSACDASARLPSFFSPASARSVEPRSRWKLDDVERDSGGRSDAAAAAALVELEVVGWAAEVIEGEEGGGPPASAEAVDGERMLTFDDCEGAGTESGIVVGADCWVGWTMIGLPSDFWSLTGAADLARSQTGKEGEDESGEEVILKSLFASISFSLEFDLLLTDSLRVSLTSSPAVPILAIRTSLDGLAGIHKLEMGFWLVLVVGGEEVVLGSGKMKEDDGWKAAEMGSRALQVAVREGGAGVLYPVGQ
jgi:hypothetical protein